MGAVCMFPICLWLSPPLTPKMCIIVKSRLSVIPIDVIVRESTSFAVYLGEEGPAMPQGLLTN